MACLKAPLLPVPTLPSPITISIPIPPIPNPNLLLCCQLNLPTVIVLPGSIVLPPLVIPTAVIATLLGFIASVNTFLDQLQISCPLE